MKLSNILGAAALTVFSAVSANAATVFNVSDNAGGQSLAPETVADGGTFTQALTVFDSVSIDVSSATGLTTSGSLFFNFAPTPLSSTLNIVLNSVDFTAFGAVMVTLSDSFSSLSQTVTAQNTEVMFTLSPVFSPLKVAFSWEKATEGSFNADVTMTPVPVPAAGLLLLGGLGALAAVRRRRQNA
jgi:hypothetical protein